MGTTPHIPLPMGSPLPYPPLSWGFLGQKGGIIPSEKSWKKIYGNRTPFLYKAG